MGYAIPTPNLVIEPLLSTAREYGDIFSLKVMHLTIIVLNSPTAVKELIDKRGGTTCNRPASIIADIITPDNLNIGTGRYGAQQKVKSN